MTREEAKHIVDVAFSVPQAVRRDGEDRTYHEDEIREAKNMAIKALSQEPCDKCKYFDGNSCQHYDYKVGYTQGYEDASKRFKQEPCDDVVSREAVIDLIKRCFPTEEQTTGCLMIESINKLPSVTQKSGKWILLDECANSGYYCSNCQKKLVKEGWSNTVKKIKYCPNCGAKMVEPQESEDKE